MKNIVFDLGGVVFARDKSKSTQEFYDFFSFIRTPQMPEFWEEYDRGVLEFDEVADILAGVKGCTRARCLEFMREAIDRQEAIAPTERLIADLKAAGYRLYVLSNMSREFIDFLRRLPVYRNFDGEVVSCEEHTVKPEPQIYEILLSRYGLEPADTLFIDDRQPNLDAAARFGVHTQLFDHRNPAATCEVLRRRLL